MATYIKVGSKEEVAQKYAEIMAAPPWPVLEPACGVMEHGYTAYVWSYKIAPNTYGSSENTIQIWTPERD